jgi:hypothetical protein
MIFVNRRKVSEIWHDKLFQRLRLGSMMQEMVYYGVLRNEATVWFQYMYPGLRSSPAFTLSVI